MSYSDFKSLEDVKKKFGISVSSGGSLFGLQGDFELSERFAEILDENVDLALNINTEKARSELIISPLLVETRKLLNRKISLFSGVEFNVDDKLGLTGFCDFILSKSPDQVFIEVPVVCIVEAKNENIKSGYAQCAAEMVAAEIFNRQNLHAIDYILGIVTTGSNWKFLKLENNVIYIDFNEYLITQAGRILGILVEAIRGASE